MTARFACVRLARDDSRYEPSQAARIARDHRCAVRDARSQRTVLPVRSFVRIHGIGARGQTATPSMRSRLRPPGTSHSTTSPGR